MTRDEHVEWAKSRAREYLDAEDPNQAFMSMCSDLGKHPETERHSGTTLGVMLLLGGHLDTTEKMRTFIEGFN